jgi:alanine racemase
VKVHLKADTGMGRLGLPPREILGLAEYARGLEGLRIEGVFTHCPESRIDCVAGQLHAFRDLLESLSRLRIRPRFVHMANSGALFLHRPTHFDLVRPGISLYGVDPGDLGGGAAGLLPALSVRTQIVFLKTVPEGGFVGYRPGYRASRATRVASLPVGYADGYTTLFSDRARVIVRGIEAPLAGRISMDYTTVDVGHVEGVRVGDVVTLLGRDGGREVSARHLADLSHTIPYEILTLFSTRRVRKIYLGDAGNARER